MQKQRCLEKWSILHAGAMRIVVEIYKYRARVLEYDTDSSFHKSKADDGLDQQDKAVIGTARRARLRFVKRVQEIFSTVMDGEISDADALSISLRQEDLDQKRPVDKVVLERHVSSNLLRLSADISCCSSCCGKYRKARGGTSGKTSDEQEDALDQKGQLDTKDIYNVVEDDDFESIISIEAYMEHRMKPIMVLCGTTAPKMAWRLQMLERLSLFLNAVTVAFAVPKDINVSHWLVLCVSAKVLVMNVIEYCAFQMRLTALNSGVKEMQNLLTWWESLSVIDRRTREAKTMAVSTVEQAMLKVWLARTGELASISSVAYSLGKAGDGEEEENQESNGRAKKE
jgi:hypothetical protein